MRVFAPRFDPPSPVALHEGMERHAFACGSQRHGMSPASRRERVRQSSAEMRATMAFVRAKPLSFCTKTPPTVTPGATTGPAPSSQRQTYASPPRAHPRRATPWDGYSSHGSASHGPQSAASSGVVAALATSACAAAPSPPAWHSPLPAPPRARPAPGCASSVLSPPVAAAPPMRSLESQSSPARSIRPPPAPQGAQQRFPGAPPSQTGDVASLPSSPGSLRVGQMRGQRRRRLQAPQPQQTAGDATQLSQALAPDRATGVPRQAQQQQRRRTEEPAGPGPTQARADPWEAFMHQPQALGQARATTGASSVAASLRATGRPRQPEPRQRASPPKRRRAASNGTCTGTGAIASATASAAAAGPSNTTPTTTYNARSRARDEAGKRSSTEPAWGCAAGDWAVLGRHFTHATDSEEALRRTRLELEGEGDVVATLVWSDLTTSFFAPELHRKFFWYNHTRAVRDLYAGRPFVAALLALLPDASARPVFIPLALCEGEDADAEGASAIAGHASVDASTGYRLPFRSCLTSAARWHLAMELLLRVGRRRCVVYNAQQLLLPFVQLAHVRGISFSWQDLAVVDARVAQWMVEPDAEEKGLRWEEMVAALAADPASAPQLCGHAVRDLDPMQCVDSCGAAVEGALRSLRVLAARWEALAAVLAQRRLLHPLLTLEAPVTGVLVEMEHTGMAFDPAPLMCGADAIEARLGEVAAAARQALGGTELNMSSPEQVARALYETLQLRPPRVDVTAHGSRKATSRHRTTSEAALSQLAAQHPLPGLVLEHRKLVKMRSTYCEGLLKEAGAACGLTLPGVRKRPRGAAPLLLHCWWNQCNTGTGRLSSSHPNLQNIPRPGEGSGAAGPAAVNVRDAFVASRAGTTLLAVDYSQIEMRVLAHWSSDASLAAVFTRGEDVYTQVAATLFDKAVPAVTPEERRRAKVVTLGVMYGMGAQDMGHKLGINTRHAADLRARLLARFPGVKRFVDACRAQAQRTGHVRTLVGRQRWLPDIRSGVDGKRLYAERQAVNTVIQGSAADIFKACILRVHALLAKPHWRDHPTAAPPRLLLQVHDEVVIEAPRDPPTLARLAREVEHEMQVCVHEELLRAGAPEVARGVALRVPLCVTLKAGDRWGTMADVDPHRGQGAGQGGDQGGVSSGESEVQAKADPGWW